MKRLASTLVVLLAIASAWAQAITPQAAADRFANDSIMKHAAFSVMFMDIDSGEEIASVNPELSVTTASTMKTVVSLAALETLGGAFKFETPVYLWGKVKKDKFKGDIIVVGSGDPTLGSKYFKDLASLPGEIVAALKARGINKVEGNIVIDNSLYPTPYYSDYWEIGDLAQYYGAGVFPLNYRDNLIGFSYNVTPEGRIDSARFSPEIPGVGFIDRSRPGKTNERFTMVEYGSNSLALHGELACNEVSATYNWHVANPCPDAYLRYDIEQALIEAGFKLKIKNIKEKDKEMRELLTTHYSPVLTDIVTSLLHRSDNMFAHSMLRAIAVRSAKYQNEGGDFDLTGVAEVVDILKRLGVDTKPLRMYDGSGLARADHGSAHMFCQMLRAIANKRYNGVRMTDLMSRAGKRVGHMLGETSLANDVSLKSGSMTDVQTFVGYYPAENPKICWAILANNWDGTRSQLRDNMDRLLIGVLLGE